MMAAAALLASLAGGASAAGITDATGRTVEVAAPATRVFVAGPPAAALVFALRPDALLGWSHGLRDSDRAMLPGTVRDLPTLPELTSDDGQPNRTGLAAAAPDLIVDYGSVDARYAAQAESVQAATGIPTVLLDGSLDGIPSTLRALGAALGVPDRAEALAVWAEATLAEVDATLARVPESERPKVYLGRGDDGLQSGDAGSINTAILARAGTVNVVTADTGRNLVTVTPAEVAAWAPDVILTQSPAFAAAAPERPEWRDVPAVTDGRVLLAPGGPFGFIDSPPSINRLIGLRWLMHALYPEAARGDLHAEVRDFYRLFYGIELDDSTLGRLLGT
jgi:iron complex transport system substrate-binding protein